MKKRLLAFALASVMMFTSVNVAFAEDTAVTADDVVIAEETAVPDDATSDAAVEDESSEASDQAVDEDIVVDEVVDAEVDDLDEVHEIDGVTYTPNYPKATVGNWKASVSGNIGDFTSIGYTSDKGQVWAKDRDGNQVAFYEIRGLSETDVYMRVGTATLDGTIISGDKGKISSTNEGLALYYQTLSPDDDFILSATANVVATGNKSDGNNQTGFGLIVGDTLVEDMDYRYLPATNLLSGQTVQDDKIVVGRYKIRDKDIGGNDGMKYGWTRDDNALGTFVSKSTVGVSAGYSIKLTLKKAGDIYTLTSDDGSVVETNVIDNRVDETGLKPFQFTKYDPENIYVGLCAARCVEINWTDVNLEKIPPVESIELTKLPDKLDYNVDEKFDPTGLEIAVKYVDGSTANLTAADTDKYSLLGFDNTENNSFTDAGEREVTVAVGAGTATFKVNVTSLIVDELTINDAPVKQEYFAGDPFNTYGFSATATLNDGQLKTLGIDDVELTIDGNVINSDTVFTAADAGTKTVKVTYRKDDPNINAGEAFATFDITVYASTVDHIEIAAEPSVKLFFTGQPFNAGGLVIRAVYSDGTRRILTPDEYTISGFSSEKVVEALPITITCNADPTKTVSYNVEIRQTVPSNTDILGYPKTTYNIGEQFVANGMVVKLFYSDNSVKIITGEDACYKDANNEYYTINDNGEKTPVSEAEASGKDYYMDISAFDNTKANTDSKVVFVINKAIYPGLKDIEFDITVEKAERYIWKAAMMGPSAIDQAGPSDSYIAVTDASGNTRTTNKSDTLGAPPDVMVDGELPNVESVHINTWQKSGKIATDQDGIAYYYTEVPGDKNFEISGTIKVHRYMQTPDTFSEDQKKSYNGYMEEGCSEVEATDRLRDGQEAFGIMARDTIQLAGGIVDGKYMGNAAKAAILSEDAAKLYYVFDANNICKGYYVTKKDADDAALALGSGAWVAETDATIYEAYMAPYGDILKIGDLDYKPVEEDVKAVAVSNIVIAGGVTDGTFPSKLETASEIRKANMNRINILVRTGVSDLSGTGSSGKVYAISSTDTIPKADDVYNISLKRFNEGYQITTKKYDEETGKWSTPRTEFAFDSEVNTTGSLTRQNSEKYYVGFFACRWAEIEVSDIHMYATNPDTDSDVKNTVVTTTVPKITVKSSPTSNYYDYYNLVFKTNGEKKYQSNVIVTLNGKRISEGPIEQDKDKSIMTPILPNAVNKFTLVMYPNTADTTFSNYDAVKTNFYVTHSDRFKDSDVIYVAPDGKVDAAGTKDDPTDLETAIQFVKRGGTIIMLDGTYNLRNEVEGKLEIAVDRSAIAGQPTTIKADEGATPIIDLQKKYVGFEVDADYWVFSGLTIINSKDNEKAFGLGGDHCLVEYCTFHHNGTTAFQISRIKSSDEKIETWPAYNVVRSCESFMNFDPSQNNADGFAAKLTVGYGNVFQDCVSHHNADDGWDCYTKVGSGAIGASVLENCISYRQAHRLNDDGSEETTLSSGGNGYKLGGEDIYVKHYLKDSITFFNKGNGVDSNNNPAVKIRNVIAYGNYGDNFSLYGNPVNGIDLNGKPSNNTFDENGKMYKYDYDLRGAVSAGGTVDNIYTWNVPGYDIYANLTPIEAEDNYLKKSSSDPSQNINGEVLDEATFFKSTDPSVSMNEMKRYSRNADGTFNHGDFLARVTPYKHAPGDEVILPDLNGGTGNVGGDRPNQSEATTTGTPSTTPGGSSSGGGGGGGGGGGSTKLVVKDKDTEATTAAADNTTAKKPVITEDVKVTIGASEIVVGDQTIPVDAAAYIQADSNSTLVPLRFVAIAILGGDVASADTSSIVAWDAQAKAATITAGDDTIVFTAGSPDMIVNGEAKTMANGVKAEISDGRMYVPFRALGEALGVEVEWDADTKTASYIAPAVEEEPTAPAGITKDDVLKAAEALDSVLSVSAERAAAMGGPEKTKYAEMSDKLATILQEAAYDMTDEQIAASVELLSGELLEYITKELPGKVNTTEEVNAKMAELEDALIKAPEAAPEAENAEAEAAEEVTTVAE